MNTDNRPAVRTQQEWTAQVDEIQEQQGWSDETMRNLALGFIFDPNPNDFVAWLRQVAAKENASDDV